MTFLQRSTFFFFLPFFVALSFSLSLFLSSLLVCKQQEEIKTFPQEFLKPNLFLSAERARPNPDFKSIALGAVGTREEKGVRTPTPNPCKRGCEKKKKTPRRDTRSVLDADREKHTHTEAERERDTWMHYICQRPASNPQHPSPSFIPFFLFLFLLLLLLLRLLLHTGVFISL